MIFSSEASHSGFKFTCENKLIKFKKEQSKNSFENVFTNFISLVDDFIT
jgi:predicted AlkP superfamily phosphohydrolase/phosphomutase